MFKVSVVVVVVVGVMRQLRFRSRQIPNSSAAWRHHHIDISDEATFDCNQKQMSPSFQGKSGQTFAAVDS